MARRKSTTASAPKASAPAPESTETPQYPPNDVLTGRLCSDPVLRHTKSGKSVTSLRLAVLGTDPQAFITCVAWNRTAEVAAQFLRKGRRVEVEGRISDRTWTGRDGKERTDKELSAYRVQFLSDRRSDGAAKEAA